MFKINSSIIALIVALVVGVGGFFAWQYLGEKRTDEIPEANEEESAPLLEETKPDNLAELTASWKNYSNELFKFSFKYPEILPYTYDSVFEPTDPSKKKVLTVPLGEDPFRVFVVTNGINALPTSTGAVLLTEKVIRIGEIETIKRTFQGSDGSTISGLSLEKEGVLFSIWAEIKGLEEERLNIFNQLLFTFRFLN